MPRPSRWLALALLLAAWLWVAPAAAQAGPPAAAGTSIGRVLLDFQREANRTIARQMREIRDGQTTAPFLLGLVLAFAYGVVHAAGPGHGKLVVMTYFLSRDARIGRGLLMGTQIAVMHVLSAVAVVVFADLLLRKGFGGAPSEVPAVRIASYGLILVIGSAMLWRAVRRAWAPAGHHHHDHDHGHACGCGARHGEGGLLSLGVGLVPCTGSVLILLYAMANGILPAGLLLVGMIALGMAVTMGGLGLLSVLARRFVADRLAQGSGRAAAAVDILGSTLIVLLGGGLLMTAV